MFEQWLLDAQQRLPLPVWIALAIGLLYVLCHALPRWWVTWRARMDTQPRALARTIDHGAR